MSNGNSLDYSEEMKEHYKSDSVAEEYHEAYTEDGNWRHNLIANRERNAVASLLKKVPTDSILDIPTGTGKLAPVFAETGSTVTACDISENMLNIAEAEYDRHGVSDARFQVCDAEEISETLDERFNVAISLRLLHRVPTDVKRNILAELGAVGDYVIASTAIETSFHQTRRNIRQRLLGGDERNHGYESPETTREIMTDGFEIIASKRVLPVLSQEHVFLLRPTE
ncbi:class I SAM-dependent methyltransferase [Halosegnis longus]|uniref:Class I SAM-dependent methyltransferase n=1 Tax=Halosegnis longus TaxID=2216012 RepID=A0AAJ4UWN5_9EURY|nr:class I SAM-dependent methyltransferase [Salella cibi]